MRQSSIARKLKQWYRRAKRDLPWRNTRDPYRIWISEIMLQQTRVAAALPYYERFLAKFPGVESLAAAAEPELLAAWAGLGYYARARNLQKAARLIVEGGGFPRDYESLCELPGVGSYTAAAISSIAFGLPYAVLDGNVARVLARVLNESGDIRSLKTRQRLQAAADEFLDRREPALFNQALMELGATICLPRQPQCHVCPIAPECEARRLGRQAELPVRAKQNATVFLHKTLLIVQRHGRILVRQRPAASSIMPGFWDLPESCELPEAVEGSSIGLFRHSVTYRNYTFTVRLGKLQIGSVGGLPQGFRWISASRLHEIPLSTTAKKGIRCLTKQGENETEA
ncbi:MAG TPA: A/G-specific adenine glycosylase [Bryobacteraceae bacterium]|nr:A/G-specific adenine glycosylase [Bryobacteraceae bacterium]